MLSLEKWTYCGNGKGTQLNKMMLFLKNLESKLEWEADKQINFREPGKTLPELGRSFHRSPGQRAAHSHGFPEEPYEFIEVIMKNATGILCNESIKTYYVLNGHFSSR